jgi:hypothetical protein
VGLNAVFKERIVCEGVRRGAKEVEKRLLRVDIVVVVVVVVDVVFVVCEVVAACVSWRD